jgi:hypothetical protein
MWGAGAGAGAGAREPGFDGSECRGDGISPAHQLPLSEVKSVAGECGRCSAADALLRTVWIAVRSWIAAE